MCRVFHSLKVVELASVLAGPSVGQFFAELGAQVIKVENPASGGDVTRSWKGADEQTSGSVSAYFSAVNAGKTSIALDLKNPKHKQQLLEMLATADVLITSYKPGDAGKLGLSYTDLKAHNPSLIYASITGYGEANNKVGYDAVLQAETGFMYLNGEPGGASLKMPVALIDVLAAHQLKEAVLLAYINRLKTGEGSEVSVSLFDAAVASLANQATNYLIGKNNPQKMGSEHPNIAPYGKLYTCSDGREIILAIGNNKQFAHLCGVLDLNELAHSHKYKVNGARVKNRAELNEILQAKIRVFQSVDLLQQLNALAVPAGLLNDIPAVFNDAEAQNIVLYNEDKPVGLRNFIAKMSFMENMPHISPPPAYKEDNGEHDVLNPK